MKSILLRMLLRYRPKMNFTPAEIDLYTRLSAIIQKGGDIPIDTPFAKARFLHYLSLQEDFLFHGSNNTKIDIFAPRKQTLYNGQVTKAVFASSEPMWSAFYAIFNKSKLIGSFRNGCMVYKGRKYHYYSLNESTMENNPWTSGMIYILPKDQFKLADQRKIHFDEWICTDFVKPASQLAIDPEDFYFLNKVAMHKDKDSFIKTLLMYKLRTLRGKR